MKRPLQVGDRVAWLEPTISFNDTRTPHLVSESAPAPRRRRGQVLDVASGHVLVRAFDADPVEDEVFPVVAAHCRRLVKRQRRRIWVRFDDDTGAVDATSPNPFAYAVEFVEVRRKP